MSIKVAINGYGTIGKRVADAVDAQDDMEIVGVTKTGPSFGCDLAVKKGFPLYCTFDDADRIARFAEQGYECHDGLSDLLAIADVVVDCSPGKLGAENLAKYQKADVKYMFEGGEKHALTGLSYTSSANHVENMNAQGTRVVSCNTTGLSRTLVPLYEHCGSLKVECTMVRRAADPGDSNKGPINAIKPVLKVPSHHGPDVMTVKPKLRLTALQLPFRQPSCTYIQSLQICRMAMDLQPSRSWRCGRTLHASSSCMERTTESPPRQRSWRWPETSVESGEICMRFSSGKMV